MLLFLLKKYPKYYTQDLYELAKNAAPTHILSRHGEVPRHFAKPGLYTTDEAKTHVSSDG